MKLVVALVLVPLVVRAETANPAGHPLAFALLSAFDEWHDGVSLTDVTCSANGAVVRCEANAGGRTLRTKDAMAAGSLIAALANDVQRADVSAIRCTAQDSVHCAIAIADGDFTLEAAVAHFEVNSLCQHARTVDPTGAIGAIRVTCASGTCELGEPSDRVAMTGTAGAALAHVIARRLGERCDAASCGVTAHVGCESWGCSVDNGSTRVTRCDVTR